MNMYSSIKNQDDACQINCVHTDTVSTVKSAMAPTEQLFSLADLFKALGDSTRVRILNALMNAELCVCDLVEIIGMTQSAISHQLRVLRTAKIVKYRKEGKNVFYSLEDNHIQQLLVGGLEHINE